MRKQILTASLVVLLVGTASTIGVIKGFSAIEDSRTENALKRINLLLEVYNTIQTEYVDADKTNGDELVTAAITRIVKVVDPHGQYFTPEQVMQMADLDDSVTAQAGVIIDSTGNQVFVVSPLEGGAAWKAGVLYGDLITRIGDRMAHELTLHEVYALFEGEPGSTIEIETWRDWVDPVTRKRERITLERGVPMPQDFSSRVIEQGENTRYGYLRLNQILPGSADKIRAAIQQMTQAGPVAGYVLDLRFCAYGNPMDGVAVAGCFLERDRLVTYLKDRVKKRKEPYRDGSAAATDAPMVVLVDGGAAGPAEIVAGALQDWRRAVIVGPRGQRTAGRCIETTVVNLDHGGALRLTTEEYLTPTEKSIQGIGITPDTDVAVTRDRLREMLAEGYFGQTRQEARARADAEKETETALFEQPDPSVPDPIDIEDVFAEPVEESPADTAYEKYDPVLDRGVELLSTARIFARAKALGIE